MYLINYKYFKKKKLVICQIYYSICNYSQTIQSFVWQLKGVVRRVVVATLNATNWEIILEPDFDEKSIVIVTAYPIKD